MITPDSPADLQRLLDEVLTDAFGDDEQLWALRQACEDSARLPAPAFVIGEPVEVVAFEYGGNPRRGLTAQCRRPDASRYVVAAADVAFPRGSEGARLIAAYRMWMGAEPLAPVDTPQTQPPSHRKVEAEALDLSAPIELVVLAPKERAARCRLLGTDREITLRSADVWDMVPGEIITVHARKQWQYARHPYLSGEVTAHRLDVAALGLQPLQLRDEHPWAPNEEYWGEDGEDDDPPPTWAQPILARGPRPSFEMEQVLPGHDPHDIDDDPIVQANELHASGDPRGAKALLVKMLAEDLRCLDAHAYLGSFAFEHRPEDAVRHFEAGFRIGELSWSVGLDAVLPWSRLYNRPFLRCANGFGLSLWRLGRGDEAAVIFEQMLSLNPSDNQGVRPLVSRIRAGERWKDRR